MARKINREINFLESDTLTYDIRDGKMIIGEKPLFITKAQPIVEYTTNSDEINTFISSILIAKVDGKEVSGVGAVEPYCEQVQDELIGILKNNAGQLATIPMEIVEILCENKCNIFIHQGVLFFTYLNTVYATIDGVLWQSFEFECVSEIEVIIINGEAGLDIAGETCTILFKVDLMSELPIELYLNIFLY